MKEFYDEILLIAESKSEGNANQRFMSDKIF